MIWDSGRRAATGTLGPADGSRGMIDTLHHAAHIARSTSLVAARDVLERNGVDREPRFLAALKAVLEVLPISSAITGIRLGNEAIAAGNDFEALYNLSRLAYQDDIGEPEQLTLWAKLGRMTKPREEGQVFQAYLHRSFPLDGVWIFAVTDCMPSLFGRISPGIIHAQPEGSRHVKEP